MKTAPLFALLCCCAALPAQQALEFAPVFRNYTTDQGLPNNWVYDIYQDKTGYIWIATDHGVCRFNGYRFEQFPDTLYTNLTSVMTGAMTEDTLGRLWYVDFQSRVFYIENGVIHPYAYNTVIEAQKGESDFFHGLMVGGAGEELWLVPRMQGGVLHLWGNGQYEHILPPDSARIQVFEKGAQSQYCLFIRAAHRRFRIDTIAFQRDSEIALVSLPFYNDNWDNGGYYFKQLSSGRWCVYISKYIYLLQQGKLLWKRPLGQHPVNSIWEDSDGALLVGYIQGGLDRYCSLDDFRADKPERCYFPGLTVSKIMRDREGGYWIGTQQAGVFYCSSWSGGNTVQTPLLAGQNIKALATDGQNRLFVGLGGGRIFDFGLENGQLKEITPPGIKFLNDLYYDPPSRTLAAAGTPSCFYRNGRWQTFSFFNELYAKKTLLTSKTLSPAAGQQGWFSASMSGLTKISVEKQALLDMANEFQLLTRFFAVLEAPGGRVWASRLDGLFEWIGGKALRRPATDHPAFHQPSVDLDLLPDSSLVLCPKGYGVVIWKPGSAEVTEIGIKDGLPFNKVYALHVGADGAIWACTPGGLSKLTPLGGRCYRVDNFTVKHGLPSNTVNDVVTLGADVWVATAKGLFRMRQKLGAAPIPAPLFDQILVNNVPYPIVATRSLPHDSANLIIQYLVLHFRSGGDIPYRFRLLKPGGDTSWTLTRQQQVYFSNLAPAAYRFEVQAQDEDGHWSFVSTLACIIRPPWYATWWARSLFALALGLFGYGIYSHRTNQIRTESRIKEEMHRLEGAALQAQMNPHFIFNCLNSIQNFILNNNSDAAVLYLAKFAKLVRSTLNASVSGEVRLEEEVQMLDNYLALEKLRFKEIFEYNIEVDESLDRAGTLLLPLIVQPFVENAVLHGMKGKEKDGRIGVTFRKEGGYMSIMVRDNGEGLRQEPFAAGKTSLGGSINRRRLELLEKQNAQKPITVEYLAEEDGMGTTVKICLPLASS